MSKFIKIDNYKRIDNRAYQTIINTDCIAVVSKGVTFIDIIIKDENSKKETSKAGNIEDYENKLWEIVLNHEKDINSFKESMKISTPLIQGSIGETKDKDIRATFIVECLRVELKESTVSNQNVYEIFDTIDNFFELIKGDE